MLRMTEVEMVAKISETASQLGYKAFLEPSSSVHGSFWRTSLNSLTRRHALRPDVLVEHKGRSVVVEAKRQQVLLGSVMQVVEYADAFNAAGILCVPDEVLPDIPGSVVAYADLSDVLICPLSGVGPALTTLLG